MSDLLRTFIAAPIDAPPALRELATRLRALGKSVRCTNLDQLHVTLKFLGRTSSSQVPEILGTLFECARLERACSLQICSLGAFPELNRPRVLWAGVRPEEVLARLASRLDAGLEKFGFVPEERSFTPHLTLARIVGAPPVPLRALFEADGDAEFGEAPLSRLILYRSHLGDGPPRYVPLGSHPLNA